MWMEGEAETLQNSTGFWVSCSLNLQKQTPQKINGGLGAGGARCAGHGSAFAFGCSYKICGNQVWHTVLQQYNFVYGHDINSIHLPSSQNIQWNNFKEKTSFLTYLQCNSTCREKEMHRRPSNGETYWIKKRKLIAGKRKATALQRLVEALEVICLRIKWKPCTVSMLIYFISNEVCNSLSEVKCWNSGNVPAYNIVVHVDNTPSISQWNLFFNRNVIKSKTGLDRSWTL